MTKYLLLASFAASTMAAQSPAPVLAEFGTGQPGVDGLPVLDAIGAPYPGSFLRFSVRNGAPGAHACVLFGVASNSPLTFPSGLAVFVNPALTAIPFTLDQAGARQDVIIGFLPDFPGLEAGLQCVAIDPTAVGGISASRPVQLVIGEDPVPALFPDPITARGDNSASRIRVADLDGDGAVDVVSTRNTIGPGPDVVQILAGDFTGFFGSPEELPTGDDPTDVAVGDIDGNGSLDIVSVSNGGSPLLSVLANNGDGTFAPVVGFGFGLSGSRRLELARLDANQSLDIVVANAQDDEVSVFLNDGTGNFGPEQKFAAGSNAVDLAVHDVNGDDIQDLVVANNIVGTVTILNGLGDGTFSTATTLTTGSFPRSPKLADLDADGLVDLVVAQVGSEVQVFRGIGGGSFGPPTSLVATESNSLVIEDSNGDGNLDIIVAGRDDGRLLEYAGTGLGSFSGPRLITAGAVGSMNTAQIEAADVDNNGVDDLVVSTVTSPMVAGIAVVLGEEAPPTGTSFSTRLELDLAGEPLEVVLLDADGDTDLDAVVCDSLNDQLSVLANDGSGVLTHAGNLPVGDTPRTIVVGDFNGDGVDDLCVGNDSSSDVSLLLGLASGGFMPEQRFPANEEVRDVLAVDLNGDGNLDVVTANDSRQVNILYGNGNGTLQPPTTIMFSVMPGQPSLFTFDVVAGHFNADSALDLAILQANANLLYVLLADGSGGFGPEQIFPLPNQAQDMRCGDFDADGRPDILVVHPEFVSVRRGDGAGGFLAFDTFATGESGSYATVADVDLDGNDDVVVADGSSTAGRSLSILLGDGNGNLGGLRRHDIWRPTAVAIGDMNGDGRPDAVATSFSGVAVFLQR